MKKYGFNKIFILLMGIFSLFGASIFIFTDVMLPVPMAEIISIGAYYGNFSDPSFSSVISFVIYLLVYLFSIFVAVAFFFSKKKLSIWLKIPFYIVLISDFAVHSYAFLFSAGYNFNYLIAAALDVIIVAVIYAEEKHIFRKKEKIQK